MTTEGTSRQSIKISTRATTYIITVLAIGAGFALRTLAGAEFGQAEWQTFFILTALATIVQLFVIDAPSHVAYFASPVFVFAGLLLLEPWLYVLLVVAYNSIDWVKERINDSVRLRSWYIQPFNVAVDLIAGLTAREIYHLLSESGLGGHEVLQVINGSITALVFVAINHTLLALALMLARNKSWRETGMLQVDTVLNDLTLLLLCYVVAVVWEINPWLMIPALSPLVPMWRALRIPLLEQEAQTDPKTGLINARHFSRRATEELERARRFGRPISIIMADLDLLRTINNTYGHLAGDAVLAGIGKIIASSVRDYDLAARFGGEEFAILLPETSAEEARLYAERLRATIEAARYPVVTSPTPLQATMSMGVACSPKGSDTLEELTHEADIAVYQAKALGRNRVVVIDDVPPEQREVLLQGHR